jgi:hypothetical protein
MSTQERSPSVSDVPPPMALLQSEMRAECRRRNAPRSTVSFPTCATIVAGLRYLSQEFYR